MIRSILCTAIVGFCLMDRLQGSVLHTVDIEPYCNTRLQSDAFLGSNEEVPDGPVVFDGTPFGHPEIRFSRPEGGNNAWKGWYQIDGAPHGQRLLDIDVLRTPAFAFHGGMVAAIPEQRRLSRLLSLCGV